MALSRQHLDALQSESGEESPQASNAAYHEPLSVHITDDWDTQMEEFFDDYDALGDIDYPPALDDF